jgi:hypothetical protein
MVLVETDELWTVVQARILDSCKWSLHSPRNVGRPDPNRRTWLAEGEPGIVVVKAVSNPFLLNRLTWTETALTILSGRGYPVPHTLWRGALDNQWSILVQERIIGEPLATMTTASLNALLALIDLQADPGIGPEGGWDTSWWIGVVLFEGWEGWWDEVQASTPLVARKLRAFVEPAWGFRLPTTDLVHGDLNFTNILCCDGTITGVVDWDDMGLGSRAADVTSLLLDFHRHRVLQRLSYQTGIHDRLVQRIKEIVGPNGLRCTVAYGVIARIALSAQRGEEDAVSTWCAVAEAILPAID